MNSIKIYKPLHSNHWFFLKRQVFSIGIFLVLLALDLIFSFRLTKTPYYTALGILITIGIVDFLTKKRVTEIQLDKETNQIQLTTKSAFSGPSQERIPLETSKIDVKTNSGIWPWFADPVTLSFSTGASEIAAITKRKDGFSNEQLLQIFEIAREFSTSSSES